MNRDEKDIFVHPVDVVKYKNGVKMIYVHNGLTLRDHFAGSVIQGLCARIDTNNNLEYIVNKSYELADLMLKQREL